MRQTPSVRGVAPVHAAYSPPMVIMPLHRTDDMTVTVSPGLAWLKAGAYWGVNAFEPNLQVLTLDTADGSLSHIDAVCVRLDKNRNKYGVIRRAVALGVAGLLIVARQVLVVACKMAARGGFQIAVKIS